MDIIDARNAFHKRNQACLNHLLQELAPQQQTCIQLLPLVFQLNTRQLPGYSGPDTPAGIYGYGASDATINLAKKFSNRFTYEPEPVLKFAPIEAVYLQHSIFEDSYRLWLICAENLRQEQKQALELKLQRITQWLKNHDLSVSSAVVSAAELVPSALRDKTSVFFAAAGLFLDHFYTEGILLAGKYPLWWLVSPDEEQNYAAFTQHVREARFVIESEYLDFGGIDQLTRKDILLQAISRSQRLQSAPLTSWLELLLLNVRISGFDHMRGLAWQLKKNIHDGEKDNSLLIASLLRPLLREAIHDLQNLPHSLPVEKMLTALMNYAPDRDGRLLRAIIDPQTQPEQPMRPAVLDLARYIQAYHALSGEINNAFTGIHDRYEQYESVMTDVDLLRQVHDVNDFMGDSAQRLPVFNPQLVSGLIQGRVLLRHEMKPFEQWLFVVDSGTAQEKIIHHSPSMLALLAWAWINHLIDQSTQVSVECPVRLVKQVEARYVLETLALQLDRKNIFELTRNDYRQPRRAQHALVFINLVLDENKRRQIEALDADMDPFSYGDVAENLVSQCEQLVISNWGDVRIQRYTGETGVLSCLSDWITFSFNAPRSRVAPFKVYGYAAGASTYLARRMEEAYEELLTFYGRKKKLAGRFVIRLANTYFDIHAENSVLHNFRIGGEPALLQYLEQPVASFVPTGIDRLAMLAMPLRDIYQRNRENLIQVFYRVQGRQCDTWVLDEKGSLCYFSQTWFDRDSYIMRWLYLLRNIRNRLKKINYQNRDLPTVEICQLGTGRLGGVEFSKVGAEMVNAERNFIDVHVEVDGASKSGRLSLVCDGRRYGYEQYADDVLHESVQYMNARMMGEGRRPVYITDVDVPLRFFNVDDRETIQTVHFLKYVRNLENRINQMTGG